MDWEVLRNAEKIDPTTPAEYLEALRRIVDGGCEHWDKFPDGDGEHASAGKGIATKTDLFRTIRGCSDTALDNLKLIRQINEPSSAAVSSEGRKPCTQCGRCCEHEVCPLGEIFLRTTTPPCPALVRDGDGKAWCGLVTNPTETMFAKTVDGRHWARLFSSVLKDVIFDFGSGCDNF